MDALCDTRNIALGELPLWMQPHYIADRVDDSVLNQVGAQAWVPQQLIELRCGGSRPTGIGVLVYDFPKSYGGNRIHAFLMRQR